MPQPEQLQNDSAADIAQQNEPADDSASPDQQQNTPPAALGKPNTSVEKTISCVSCRRRKLKCDRAKPKCGTCSRLRHDCEYPERRRNLGSKRRNMKELEARLAQVETKLVSETNAANSAAAHENGTKRSDHSWNGTAYQAASIDFALDDSNDVSFSESTRNRQDSTFSPHSGDGFSQDLVSLGMQEPLPPEELQRDLFQIYFDVVHSAVPMIHKYRFQAALKLGHNLRPPICLQYAMWAIAASVSPKYGNFSEVFYERARRYAEAAEMKGQGEAFITVYHAQCWNLIATLEAKKTYFTRAWMSTGKCVRLVQMMGLYRLDQDGVEVRQIIAPPSDAIELEERRRTFWAAYYGDRWASAGTGWPMTINQAEIFTNLPCSEEAFAEGRVEPSIPLSEALTGDGASKLRSPFAGVLLAATLFGHNFAHIHHKGPNDHPEDLTNGAFWRRHREMDNTLSNTFMHLPERFRLPLGLRDLDVVFLNMNIHTSTICLHQAAVLATAKHGLDPKFKWLSISRCLMAADEITTIMRLVSHNDASNMNSWMGFCLYVAGGVYVHDLRLGRPPSPNSATNLDFLLIAMKAIGKRHSITNHFTAQLEFDIDTAGLDSNSSDSRKETGVITEASPNPSSNGQRTADGSPATFDDHEITQFSKATYMNDFLPSNRGMVMPQPPLSGILQYDGEDCLIGNGRRAQDYFEPGTENTSRFFISSQMPGLRPREKSSNPASQSPSNIATDIPLHVMASLPKSVATDGCLENDSPREFGEKPVERPSQQDQPVASKRKTWNNNNLPNFDQDQTRSRTPSGQAFGVIDGVLDRASLAEQAQIAEDNPDLLHPGGISGIDFSNVTQYPIRENHKSPEFDMWNTQPMDTYNMDPSWNIDMVDTNMHDNFNLEGEGLREFLNHSGIGQWNRD